jgi:predicted ATPase
MPAVILAGPPGSGKTTLLLELARQGFATIGDSAREVIAERLSRGEPPRPDPLMFALELLRRDEEKYNYSPKDAGLVFFDRSVMESLAMVNEVASMKDSELREKVALYRFHPTVFLLPPWAAIYQTDAERDHTFAHAEYVYSCLITWYRWCGFTLSQVPCVNVVQRADYVLQSLTESKA